MGGAALGDTGGIGGSIVVWEGGLLSRGKEVKIAWLELGEEGLNECSPKAGVRGWTSPGTVLCFQRFSGELTYSCYI